MTPIETKTDDYNLLVGESNALLAIASDKRTEEQRNRMPALDRQMSELDAEIKLTRKASETVETTAATVDSEMRERVELRGKVSVVSYCKAALEMRAAVGAEAEFNAALGMGSDKFPLELLAPETEVRAFTDADAGPSNPVRWVDRLFSQAAAQAIGVTFDSVAPGVASYPVTTAGATAAQRGRSQAASAAAWTVGVTELKPKLNAVHGVFSIQDAARIGPGLEAGLQRDFRASVMDGVDKAIFLGDNGANEDPGDITGFRTAGISESTLTQSNKVKGSNVLSLFASFIDGKHANSPQDVRIVASVGSNVLWMTTVQAATVENQTVAQFLRASELSWTTRGEIDTATTNGKFGAFVGLNQGIEGAAVAAVWSAGSLIRDPYSGADSGEVGLTLNYLWDFKIPRTSNFRRLKYVS